jgi:SAM-dependent methyltransferase
MEYLQRVMRFNSSRYRLRLENAQFAAQVPAGAFVLDAGAGVAPYRSLFTHAVYESADFEKVDKPYAKSTYVCDLSDIPVEDARFDFILFNQVMEHLPEPSQVLRELHRVLKPDGKMIYTGPLFYEEHEQPYDFYRYTRFGLQHLLTTAGFAIERLDWLEGYFGTVAYQFSGMSHDLPSRPREVGAGLSGYLLVPAMWVLKAGCAVSSVFFHALETRIKFQSRGYPKNYVAIARKAAGHKSEDRAQPRLDA